MIALARAYPSLFGAPILTAIDPAIFTLRYFAECLSCATCADQCCQYGVDIDWANMEALRTLGPNFFDYIGAAPQDWFTDTLIADPEFPSGAHARTRTKAGKCIFAEPKARGCRIHAYCLQEGLDYQLYKPLVSVLFPLTFEHGALIPAAEVLDRTLVCAGSGQTLYDAVRPELLTYFGTTFVDEMDGLRAQQKSVL